MRRGLCLRESRPADGAVRLGDFKHESFLFEADASGASPAGTPFVMTSFAGLRRRHDALGRQLELGRQGTASRKPRRRHAEYCRAGTTLARCCGREVFKGLRDELRCSVRKAATQRSSTRPPKPHIGASRDHPSDCSRTPQCCACASLLEGEDLPPCPS